MKHTSGPWYPINYAGYWTIQDKDEYDYSRDLLDEEKCICAPFNAQLAAAAPELLEALQKIMTWINTHPRKATIVRSVINEAQQAINKATK